MKKKPSLKQVLALTGVALLLAMYLLTFIFSLMNLPWAQTAFRASIACTMIIPVFLYGFLLAARALRPSKSPVVDNIVFDVGSVLMDIDRKTHLKNMECSPEALEAINYALENTELWSELDKGLGSYEEIVSRNLTRFPQYEKEMLTFINTLADYIKPYPYTERWLRGLKNAGYNIYILSNWPKENYEEMLKRNLFGFMKYTDGAVWSFNVHMKKPDAEIFNSLISEYGLIPSRTVYIDDMEENVIAGKKAGLLGIQFKDFGSTVARLKELGVKSR
ncbi:MAG: HAD family hydrolase [Lachnospiraceae bacterium]|jgi:putative hydrolase of the HAD superfamily